MGYLPLKILRGVKLIFFFFFFLLVIDSCPTNIDSCPTKKNLLSDQFLRLRKIAKANFGNRH